MIDKEITSVVWDLDGTLLDSFGVFQEVLAEILPDHNLVLPSLEVLVNNYHGSLADSINSVLGGLESDKLNAIVQDFLTAQNSHYEVIEHHIFPDALRLAERAHKRGLTQILVTNRDHEGRLLASPRSIVERSALKSLIDITICGDDSEHRKPNPEVFGSLLEDGTIKPELTVVIGDQFVDGEFARNLGAKAILVSRNSEQIAHMNKLGTGWQDHVNIVSSLDEVSV